MAFAPSRSFRRNGAPIAFHDAGAATIRASSIKERTSSRRRVVEAVSVLSATHLRKVVEGGEKKNAPLPRGVSGCVFPSSREILVRERAELSKYYYSKTPP